MNETEIAAREFAATKIRDKNRQPDNDIFFAAKEGFKEGAEWQANQSQWISIDDKFPDDKSPVLCSSSIYGKVVLCWDELSQTWSYPESFEFYCDWYRIECWMNIPEL